MVTRTSTIDFGFKIKNDQLYRICTSEPISKYIKEQQIRYFADIVRKPNDSILKQLTFDEEKRQKKGRPLSSLKENVAKHLKKDIAQICKDALNREL